MKNLCAIAEFPPLCVINKHIHPRIEIFLDEPLLQIIDMKKLAAQCAFADTLIQMDQKNKGRKHFDSKALQELQRMCRMISPTKPYMSVLRESGILDCFLSLKRFLEANKSCSTRKHFQTHDTTGKNYLAYVALLNQLLTITSQIREDLYQPLNHKYMAHQVALLYQCINHVKGEAKPLNKRVEERFDGLKNLVENNRAPCLTESYIGWLRDLTDDVRMIISSFPPDIRLKLERVEKTLKW